MRKVTDFCLIFNVTTMILADFLKSMVTFYGIYGILSRKRRDIYAR